MGGFACHLSLSLIVLATSSDAFVASWRKGSTNRRFQDQSAVVAESSPPRTIFPTTSQRTTTTTSSHPLALIPVRTFGSDMAVLSDSSVCLDQYGRFQDYDLGLAEEVDLVDVSQFVVRAFGTDAITMSQDMAGWEQSLFSPAVELVNGYSGIVAFVEVLAGLRSRLEVRLKSNSITLSAPNLQGLSRQEQIRMAAGTSLVLALAKQNDNGNSETEWRSDVIASVELRLQPRDAKIPFSLPWIDRIERWLASLIGFDSTATRDLQPYLSNLCVDPAYRGQGIGKALVRSVEGIAKRNWGYKKMYLHVDIDNDAALSLYKKEGYTDVGLRWNPFWAGKAADIGYYVKNLSSS